MTWNHRVVRTTYPKGEVGFGIHEAFYNKPTDTVPHSITAEPVAPIGETLEDLVEQVQRNLKAASQPVLELVGGKVQEYKE